MIKKIARVSVCAKNATTELATVVFARVNKLVDTRCLQVGRTLQMVEMKRSVSLAPISYSANLKL